MFEVNQHVRIICTRREVIIEERAITTCRVKTLRGISLGIYEYSELEPIIETITYRQWDACAARIERANLSNITVPSPLSASPNVHIASS